jgi:hemolysin III
MPDRCPGQISWHYDRAEIIADGVVHAIGVCLGLIGATTIVVTAVKIERINLAPILVYVIGFVTMLAFSAAYNIWPVSPVKWVLRRFDHSAIYLLIAGTYTPFLAQMKSALVSAGLGIGVWLSAFVGMALKLAFPGRFDRLAIILCLLLGWSGVIAYDSLASAIPSLSLWLLAIGGVLILARHALSCLAAPALSKSDLAWFCVARVRLPLFGGPRLPAPSVSGPPRRSGSKFRRRCSCVLTR